MGKTKKTKSKVSLEAQLEADKFTKPSTRKAKNRPRQEETDYVDEKLTKRILSQARQQQIELEEECGIGPSKSKIMPLMEIPTLGDDDEASLSEESDVEDKGQYECEQYEVNEEDAKALEMFMAPDAAIRRTLADVINERVTEKRTELASQASDLSYMNVTQLDPKVLSLYRGVRDVLSKYRSGKLPKAFKVVPKMSNWEQILSITEPEKWSAAAMYQATRIFASNLKERMAQRFFNLVLLPRIRDDIIEYKRLNFHLYQALRKSLFKPGAFFKGILLPLCEAGDCTLREAVIIGSVLVKNSVPMLHSAAAIIKISEMQYNGANSIFLRILIDKKYALPYRVVDAVVYHFLKFEHDKREMPVLWHQAFLVFAELYKEDISSDQKALLLNLIKIHTHPGITPSIRMQLQNSKCRDVEMVEPE